MTREKRAARNAELIRCALAGAAIKTLAAQFKMSPRNAQLIYSEAVRAAGVRQKPRRPNKHVRAYLATHEKMLAYVARLDAAGGVGR